MKAFSTSLYLALISVPFSLFGATITHELDVEIVQVFDDAGSNGVSLLGTNGPSFIYSSAVNDIWNQAGIQINFSVVSWNNTEAQRLTTAERTALYNGTFSQGTGDAQPGLTSQALQIFFVNDHTGTGYDGSASSGWVGTPLVDPNSSGRNAGNAQLYIDGTFTSNGRVVMANEGIAADQLGGTLAHEIGHSLGLRHVGDVSSEAAGTTQDPNYSISGTTPNLMWAAGNGPAYDGALDDDPGLTLLQENYTLTTEQITAAIYNGERLDPDGNLTPVLRAVPEPSITLLMSLSGFLILIRKRK